MPAQAGIQLLPNEATLDHGRALDSGFRRDDGMEADFEVTYSCSLNFKPRIVPLRICRKVFCLFSSIANTYLVYSLDEFWEDLSYGTAVEEPRSERYRAVA